MSPQPQPSSSPPPSAHPSSRGRGDTHDSDGRLCDSLDAGHVGEPHLARDAVHGVVELGGEHTQARRAQLGRGRRDEARRVAQRGVEGTEGHGGREASRVKSSERERREEEGDESDRERVERESGQG